MQSTTNPRYILSIKLPIAPDNIKDEQNMFNLSFKCVFMSYAKYIINRIKNDKLDVRLDVLNEYFETGNNSFYEKFQDLI